MSARARARATAGASGSLSGKCIVVTRPHQQSRPLVEALKARGARVLEAPAIRIAPLTDGRPLEAALSRLETYDWIVFTSANAVTSVFESVSPESVPPTLSIAAVGPATSKALQERGLRADVVPGRFVAEDVFRALSERIELAEKRFLLPRADIAKDVLPRLLERAGAAVVAVAAYRTVTSSEETFEAVTRVKHGEVDVVTFTSASTVQGFLGGVERSDVLEKFEPASIGPVTTAALRELGYPVVIEARSHTTEGLVDAIISHFERIES